MSILDNRDLHLIISKLKKENEELRNRNKNIIDNLEDTINDMEDIIFYNDEENQNDDVSWYNDFIELKSTIINIINF
tara:strand:- start:2334 stop:2564 length:231 start_codon:yes stop_codon:yes gene_type:complete